MQILGARSVKMCVFYMRMGLCGQYEMSSTLKALCNCDKLRNEIGQPKFVKVLSQSVGCWVCPCVKINVCVPHALVHTMLFARVDKEN